MRDRGHDVLMIADFFLEANRSRLGLGGLRLTPDAEGELLGHDWPGNVRELEHLIARSALRALSSSPGRPRILSLGAEELGIPARSPRGAAPIDSSPVEGVATPPLLLRDAVDAYERRQSRKA